MKPEKVRELGKDDQRVWFETNADRRAFLQVLKRSVSPVSKSVKDLQLAEDGETCGYGKECDSQPYYGTGKDADFVVMKEQKDIPICWPCLETLIDEWINDMQENIKYHLDRYAVSEEL